MKTLRSDLNPERRSELVERTVRHLCAWNITCSNCRKHEKVIEHQQAIIDMLTVELGKLARNAEQQKTITIYRRRRQKSIPFGFVYVIKASGLFKIGYTSDPSTRLSAINSCSPDECETVLTFKTGQAYQCEQYLHARFASRLVKGEWFSLRIKDMDWIEAFSLLTDEQRLPFIESLMID